MLVFLDCAYSTTEPVLSDTAALEASISTSTTQLQTGKQLDEVCDLGGLRGLLLHHPGDVRIRRVTVGVKRSQGMKSTSDW